MNRAVDAAAAAAVARVRMRLAAAMAAALPGAEIEETAAGVVVRGRGLARRALEEAALVWPAGLVK